MKNLFSSITSLLLMLILASCNIGISAVPVATPITTVMFPSDQYPQTAIHIKEAIKNGESDVCTIDRNGADKHRKESLRGIPTKKGYDRDEFPMAMCAEGGTGADIMYIDPSDNRGAGSWMSNQLEKYSDGTKVKIIVK